MNRAPLLSTGISLAIGAAIAGIMACGGAMQSKSTAPRPAVDAGGMPAGATHDQRIVELDAKITAEFAKLDAGQRQPAPPSTCVQPPCEMSPLSLKVKPSADPECKPGASTACKDTCTLGDSICDNAKKICEIAKDLNDAWATGKCADGETSCNTAHDRCCSCM